MDYNDQQNIEELVLLIMSSFESLSEDPDTNIMINTMVEGCKKVNVNISPDDAVHAILSGISYKCCKLIDPDVTQETSDTFCEIINESEPQFMSQVRTDLIKRISRII